MVVLNAADGFYLREHHRRVGVKDGECFDVFLGNASAPVLLPSPVLGNLYVRHIPCIVFHFKTGVFERNVVQAGNLSQYVVIDVYGETSELAKVASDIMQQIVSRHAFFVNGHGSQFNAKAETLHELCIAIEAERRRPRSLHDTFQMLGI